jgi:putative Ca2+/H+ antiporter (TMEM165/GDT1 family)
MPTTFDHWKLSNVDSIFRSETRSYVSVKSDPILKCWNSSQIEQLATDLGSLVIPFFTVAGTIFVAELTDKDALLLLTLATRIRPLLAFLSGAVAFTITTTIIVTVGYFLVNVVPVFWIRLIGGFVMIGFAIWQYVSTREGEHEEEELVQRTKRTSAISIFLGAVSLLILLDLAGDATEILTIVFVAHYNAVLVFFGAVSALVTAAALETFLGSRLKRYLSMQRLRRLSFVIFLIIGSFIVVTSFVPI